jgi:hypothetical protein
MLSIIRNMAVERMADFSIGPMRLDHNGPYRIFTIYGKDPWQGILRHDGKEWFYTGECWIL